MLHFAEEFCQVWDISRQKIRHLTIWNFVCREVGQVWDGGLGAAALPRHGLCLQHWHRVGRHHCHRHRHASHPRCDQVGGGAQWASGHLRLGVHVWVCRRATQGSRSAMVREIVKMIQWKSLIYGCFFQRRWWPLRMMNFLQCDKSKYLKGRWDYFLFTKLFPIGR